MIEDRMLIYRFKRGSGSALGRIYEKYRGYLLTLATALLKDVNSAEDVVHDFFVSFALACAVLEVLKSLVEEARTVFRTEFPDATCRYWRRQMLFGLFWGL